MTSLSIAHGKFAYVFSGNANYRWLPEGDDLQERANARIHSYWITEGRDCPIAQRHVEGYAVMAGDIVVSLHKTRDGAELAIAMLG